MGRLQREGELLPMAIAAGDRAAAELAMREHLSNVAAVLVSAGG